MFQKLEYLVAVANEKNISKAAQKLYISQPSLSNSIKKSEEALQFRLFERTQNGIVLTRAGELYIEWAKEVLVSERELLNNIYQELNGSGRSTVLCISSMWSSLFLPEITSRIYEHDGAINLEVHNITSSFIEQKLIDESADVGFMTLSVNNPASFSGELEYRKLFMEQILIMIPRNGNMVWREANLHCRKEEGETFCELDAGYLKGKPFVLSTEQHRLLETAEQFFKRTGITHTTVLKEDTMTTATFFVENGKRAAFVNESFAKRYLMDNERIRLCRVKEIIPWEVIVAWKKGVGSKQRDTVIRAIEEMFWPAP